MNGCACIRQAFHMEAGFLLAFLLMICSPQNSTAVLADQYLTAFTTAADPGYSATVTTDSSGHPVVDLAVTNITTVMSRIPVAVEPDGEGCDLTKTSGNWNCANYGTITLDVQNMTDQPVLVAVEILDSTLTTWKRLKGQTLIGEWATKPVDVSLVRDNSDIPAKLTANGYNSGIFSNQVALPGEVRSGWNAQNLAAIKKISVIFPEPYDGARVKVKNIRSTDEATMLTSTASLLANEVPLVDQYGQHRTADSLTWTYKVSSQNNLNNQLISEMNEMDNNPSVNGLPANVLTSWGGWRTGPTRTATGSFRTEKINGRWWFVDANGNLFWSLGINGISISSSTPYTSARSGLFEWVPATTDPLYQFFTPTKSIDFAKMNAYRKYGTDWEAISLEMAKDRIFNWRMNTAGAWSHRDLGRSTGANAMPYTVYINLPGTTKELNGSTTYNGDLPDVFDASFASGLSTSMANEAAAYSSHNDAMCIGYFVLNEVPFGNGLTTITSEAFKAPATSAGKATMIGLFKSRYSNNLSSLNAAWGTSFANWTALSNTTVMPSGVPSTDLQAFSDLYITNFYQKCRAGVKATAPNKLYLGSRINIFNHPKLIEIASLYCDVLSFNVYHTGVENLSLPAGTADKPILISEFHFGSIGTRGSIGGGLCPTRDIKTAAALFDNYINKAILHPGIAGVHWFCYQDQSLTGRLGNGENNRIGFVSITDYPYSEMVKAARTIGSTMYAKRYNVLTYEDCFIGGTYALNGRTPGPGSGTWTADTAVFQANGVIATTGTNLDRCAYLPFTPVSGKIYKVSVKVSGFSSSDAHRLGVGFFVNPTITKTPYNSRGALTFMRAQNYSESVSTETYDWGDRIASTNAARISVILDTRATQWQVRYQVNDVSWKTNTFSANPAISAVGMTRDLSSGGGTFDEFVFETLPKMP